MGRAGFEPAICSSSEFLPRQGSVLANWTIDPLLNINRSNNLNYFFNAEGGI